MEALYHKSHKMVLDVQNSIGRLETASEDMVPVLESEIGSKVNQLASNCERLDMLVNKEPPSRRANAKLRVDQLRYDSQHLQSAINNLQYRRHQRDAERYEREALLSRRFAPNESTEVMMNDAAVQQHGKLIDAGREMDALIAGGAGIVSSLRTQGASLKGAHRKLMDAFNVLGLSNTVLRLIERRAGQDKYILYIGMVITVILMWFIWKYLA